ncbi:MAG TPA: flagellar biosynthesis protein FlhF [Lacipirellulaceae bacterium]|jgi:flagellar biosynthesis protein FlhF|nr:flagellar biosynthesis protein FlhF [Lacipirellulaceae bacterium]
MDIKTYRAKTMRDALELVRRELGPAAAVLHTREVNGGPLRRLMFGRKYEVAASATVNVPSRLPVEVGASVGEIQEERTFPRPLPIREGSLEDDYRARYRDDFRRQVAGQLDELHAIVEKLCDHASSAPVHDLPEAVFRAFTDLIDAEVDEAIAREWIDEIRRGGDARTLSDPALVKVRVIEMLENDVKIAGPIFIEPGKCRVVALIGPTGVGKTTTIAKLAANYRLREKRRVGLITVDTYRVAAVEQLRTYADIIDLPMEVVATPREMREAVARMGHLDLVLMDTAGRSPRDEVKIQELKSMLAEAEPDEVHLVLSSAAGAKNLISTAEKFADVGTTAMVLTKLDEAHSLGHLVSLVRNCRLPVSYLTDGQNVPDDIQIAQRGDMAERLLGIA